MIGTAEHERKMALQKARRAATGNCYQAKYRASLKAKGYYKTAEFRAEKQASDAKYRAAHANDPEWRKRKNASQRSYEKRWPERRAETVRRYHEKLGLIESRGGPPIGELRQTELMKNAIYVAAHRALPKGLPRWIRDDVITDMILAVLEGKIEVGQLMGQAQKFVRQYHRDYEVYSTVSLNENMPGGERPFIDMVTADDLPWN